LNEINSAAMSIEHSVNNPVGHEGGFDLSLK